MPYSAVFLGTVHQGTLVCWNLNVLLKKCGKSYFKRALPLVSFAVRGVGHTPVMASLYTLWSIPTPLRSTPTTLWSTPTTLWSTTLS